MVTQTGQTSDLCCFWQMDPEALADLVYHEVYEPRTMNAEPRRERARLAATSTLNLTGCLGKK